MKKLFCGAPDFEREIAALFERPGYPPEIERNVAAILDDVAARGDAAVYYIVLNSYYLFISQFAPSSQRRRLRCQALRCQKAKERRLKILGQTAFRVL